MSSPEADRQWWLHLIKEGTATYIAVTVVMVYLYTSVTKIDSPALTNIAFLILGFYFRDKTAGENFPRRRRVTDEIPQVSSVSSAISFRQVDDE